MRAAKSYLAAHPSWFNENPDLSCPRCQVELETFQHAILTCAARARDRDLLLNQVSSLRHDAATWTEPHLLRALAKYIMTTETGFTPDMIPVHYLAPSPPPPPPSPPAQN